ncbi:interleukin-15 receptor subunit alpha-like [Syngnathus typhle]|uniref:interleukin-15 receptor subunit alpha-like n=1 Tax=Syngnathus typhle TaxID=161592 RepID=UPI002A6B6029|nr:interleukin-15 receptor subunit alpha-like [Syngnathus typhle]
MALGFGLLLVVCVVACVLGKARCSDSGQSECPCSGIPRWPQTQPPPQDCHQLNRTFRYICRKGYLRTAGTSNLIRCKAGSWSSPDLVCKRDPRGGASDDTEAEAPTTSVVHTTEAAATTSVEKHRNISEPADSLINDTRSDASLWQTSSSLSGPGITTIAAVVGVLVAIAVALIGIGLLCKTRRGRTSDSPQMAPEDIPLNEATS